MMAAASKLDTAKFRKVHGLMTGGATEGERSAARARADAMARKAGMTLNEAVSSLDAKAKGFTSTDFFAGFDDHMEAKQPGYKVEQARKKGERADRASVRRAEILDAFGTEAAFLDRTNLEAALLDAIRPFVTRWESWKDTSSGRVHHYPDEIGGKRADGVFWKADDLEPSAVEAIVSAYPWPAGLAEMLTEARMWDQLRLDRGLFCGGEWSQYPEVEIRVSLLEHALDGGQPAASWEDLQARFDWKRWEWERQWIDPTERKDPFLDRLEADFAILRDCARAPAEEQSAPVQNRHRTTGEKRADILSMLDTHPELSDREIARRVGASPQTVNTWRKRRRV